MIQPVVQSKQTETVVKGVPSNEEIGKNSARAKTTLSAPASNVLLEGTPRESPNGFAEFPIHRDACVPEERIEKCLRP